MKKIFTVMMALVMVMGASAEQWKMSKDALRSNQPVSFSNISRKNVPAMPAQSLSFSKNAMPAPLQAFKMAMAESTVADTAFYQASPDLVFYSGFYPDGYGPYPTLMQPYDQEVTFYNLSIFNEGEQFGWSYDEGTTIETTDTNLVVPVGTFQGPGYGGQIMPTLVFESGESYHWAMDEEEFYWYSFIDEVSFPYTKCHMYTNPKFNDGESSDDCTFWSWSESMPYLFGTGLDLSQYGFGLIDTLGTSFGVEGYTCNIDTITAFVVSWGAQSIQLGTGVKMTLYPITITDSTMSVDWKKPITSSTATSSNITYSYTYQGNTIGVVSWPIKASIDGLFWIEISGMNSTGANFGFAADGADGLAYGDTYMLTNNQFKNFFYMNIALSVNATMKSQSTGLYDAMMEIKENNGKFMQNGQLYIKKGNKVFNTLGAEIAK